MLGLTDAGPLFLQVQPHRELAELWLPGYFICMGIFLLFFTVFLSPTQQ